METRFILFVMLYLGFLAFLMNTDIPEELKVIKPFDFVWFAGGIVGVAGACTVVTGVPCPVALGLFTVGTFLNYVISQSSWIKFIIFLPIITTLIYIVARLGRGGG